MLESNIQVKTNNFDGPLGLLLLLIQKEEMDIKNLDITVITQQYLSYLKRMSDLNFDTAGDYLYMASTLLHIKSKTCITDNTGNDLVDFLVDDDDAGMMGQAELIRRLEELQRFQSLGERLWMLPKKGHEIFVKPKVNRKKIIDSILTPMDLESLTGAMIDFLRKENRKYTVVKRDTVSIKEKLEFLKTHLSSGEQVTLDELLSKDQHNEEDRLASIVIIFISILELAKLKKLEIFQNEIDSSVYIKAVTDLDNFNMDFMDDYENESNVESNIENESDSHIASQLGGGVNESDSHHIVQ
jgi:segregation and condensation protein A